MNAPPTTIRRSEKAARAAGFERLLAIGLAQVQQISGERWTDHNLHDPGITVLEQLCFALTELAYRVDFPVADHLTGPDRRIDFDALALHAPRKALTCRATTEADYRRLLLDRVDGLDDAHLHPAPAGVVGVYRLRLKLAGGERCDPDPRLLQALGAYRAERSLCEDVEPRALPVKDRECELHADIEITGPRDAAEVMAEVYHRAGRWIDRHPRLLSLHELLERKLTLDQVYDGPVTAKGFADDAWHDDRPGTSLYLADLAKELEGVMGIKQVHTLELETPDRRRHTVSLVWREVDWALRLHVPGKAGDLRKVHVQLRRRQHKVQVPPSELWHRVQNLQAAERSQRYQLSEQLSKEEAAELPRGAWREPTRYHSVQHHFPAIYGLGRNALSAAATRQDQARSRQMRGYLLLFDQILANGEEQVRHLRELYSVAARGHQSYWWAALGPNPERRPGEPPSEEERSVPGLEGLMRERPEVLAQRMAEDFDRSSMRKSRLLDHLLALHGETFTQNALRQYCGHLRADELDQRLMANKARYLQDIVTLSRDRAGAFDYSRPLWDIPTDQPANFSGLARRVCLLLGFKHDHARPLTRARELLQAELPLSETDDAPLGQLDEAQALAGEAIDVVVDVDARDAGPMRDPMVLLKKHSPTLAGALLRAGAGHDGYRLLYQPAPGAARPAAVLTLAVAGPEDSRRWWRLGRAGDGATARRAAAQFRKTFIDINDDCEGLHLVEHVLLRPVLPDSAAHARLALHDDFYGLRLSVVMPDWTVRTHQPPFRQLAEETLLLNVPAHISLHRRQPVLWLGFEDMQHFERDFERWLTLRMEWCRNPAAVALAVSVDAAACKLLEWLPRDDPAPAPAEASRHG